MKLFLTFALVMILTACSHRDQPGANQTDSISSDHPSLEPSSENGFIIELRNADNVQLNTGTVVYRLYGFDSLLADIKATLVTSELISLVEFPGSIEVGWPDNAAASIVPPVSSDKVALYYIALYIDQDMDGQLCNGDFRQDYSNTDFFTISEKPEKAVEYYLTEINSPDQHCEGY